MPTPLPPPERSIAGLFLGLAVLLAGGCALSPSLQAQAADSPRHAPLTETIQLQRRTLVFEPSRADLSVGCVVLTMASSAPVRVNGLQAKSPQRWRSIYLKQVGTNRFALPALKIDYAPHEADDILCLSLKLWFNEVSNMHDSPFYENVADRYALVSWCSKPPESASDSSWKARFSQNREAELKAFQAKLAQPLPIRLNQRKLQADWGYPMIYNSPRVSEADLNAIEKAVRDRDEQHLITLQVTDADHATVYASVEDATRFHGTREYKLVRSEGTWKIEKVEKMQE